VEKAYDESLSAEEQGRLKLFGYSSDLYAFSAAADVVVTRAGATNLAEFALQGKACIIVPSAFLAAGHQIKNAQYLEDKDAAIIIDEDDLLNDPNRLAKILSDLMTDKVRRRKLGENLAEFANPNSAKQIAKLILETGGGNEAAAH
jgi:UDP-N-acetylglucosamine--N-acetylmuramyl-(pentapeptide) pyrophosphoryl-undecaprenol N-acetylglucosamine transferase